MLQARALFGCCVCLLLQVFELVKNSLRAVQERYADSDTDPPPIQVVVAQGLEDVTIKVRQAAAACLCLGCCSPRVPSYGHGVLVRQGAAAAP